MACGLDIPLSGGKCIPMDGISKPLESLFSSYPVPGLRNSSVSVTLGVFVESGGKRYLV